MTLTFNNICSESPLFFNGTIKTITLNFNTSEVTFECEHSATTTIFFNFEKGDSQCTFRIPDPSGEGSLEVVIFLYNGTLKIQNFIAGFPK